MESRIREDNADSLKLSSVSNSSHSSVISQRRLSWLCSGNAVEDDLLVSFNSGENAEEDDNTDVILGLVSGGASHRTFLTDSIVTLWRSRSVRRERRFSSRSLTTCRLCGFFSRFCQCLFRRNCLLMEERQDLMDSAMMFESERIPRSRSYTDSAVQVSKGNVTELCTRPKSVDEGTFCNLDEEDENPACSLRCHVLFSSPLCIERGWTVLLTCQHLKADYLMEVDAEVLTWGLEFSVACPAVVESVQLGGQVAAFNSRQEHAESMVRPGDELWQISIGSCAMPVHGQSAATVLRNVLSAMRDTLPTEDSKPVQLGLVFRGLRAMKQLCVEREIAALEDSGCGVQAAAATAENIRSLLATGECRILHLIFHSAAEKDNFIILEDRLGKAHVLRATDLNRLLTGGQEQQNIALVFLNSCHSLTLGKHFISAGVRHVVCVRDEDMVRDESCWLFASHFFKALGVGKSVQDAFDCGVTVLDCSQDPDLRSNARSFALLPANGDHSEVFLPICTNMRASQSLTVKSCKSWGAVLPPIEDFLGREVDVYRLVRVVDSRRYVEVHGEPGVGKTALLAELGRFLQQRKEVFHEVRWINHSEVCTAGLEDLHLRLEDMPRHRVLLLVDTDAALAWPQVQALLHTTKDVHLLAASSGRGRGADTGPVAIAAGLKPIRFLLGPLDPLAQAQLLLRRTGRPLFTFELLDEVGRPSPVPPQQEVSLLCPRAPADFLALAGQPKLRALGGNPARIVAMAQQLSESPPPFFTAAISSSAVASISCSVGQRRVRLLRPDGRTKDEWISQESRISDILELFAPRELGNSADIFIDGCHAQLNMPLSSFEEDPGLGILVIEFRRRDSDDW